VEPINNVADASRQIESFDGPPEEFILPISDELQDAFGMNMAVITDYVLNQTLQDWDTHAAFSFRVAACSVTACSTSGV
jgi:hypothetical protein